jgi:predicted aminopeptidase
MLRWDDIQLIGTLFHELAHQVLYVKGDTGFNESFATAVEEFGLQRWLQARGQPEDLETYWQRRQLREQLMTLVDAAREDLREHYAAPLDDDEKRRLKAARLLELGQGIRRQLERAGRSAADWPSGELNNARLASMTLYEGWLPAFRALLRECNQDLPCFYTRAAELASLEREAREERLTLLARR